MSSMTNQTKLKVGNALLRNTAFTPPVVLYLALFTNATTAAGGGTEVSTGGYARQAISFNAADANYRYWQSSLVTFGPATGAWGTIYNWAVYDALTVGVMWLHGRFMETRVVQAGDVLEVQPSELGIAFP